MKKLILALLACFSITAFADAEKLCSNYAQYAFAVATARDAKVDRLQLKEQTFTMIDEGKAKKFVTEQKPELSRIVDILYANPQVGPEEAAKSYFVHCMQVTTDI